MDHREPDGCLAGDFDAEFLRTQRSDALHVAIRLGTLALVYGLLARAVREFTLGAAFLLLPMALEWLLVMWLGLLLSRRFVNCPGFARSSNRPLLVVGWTLVIGLIISLVLAWDGASDALSISRIPNAARAALATVYHSGLIWALLAGTLILLVSTGLEVRRWRRIGGAFVWTSIIESGLRFVGLLAVGMVGAFVLVLFGDSFAGWLLSTPLHRAWTVFAVLLIVEVFGVLVGSLMHRDLARKANAMTPVKHRHARSPGFPG